MMAFYINGKPIEAVTNEEKEGFAKSVLKGLATAWVDTMSKGMACTVCYGSEQE